MPARYLPLLVFLIHGLQAQPCLSLSTGAVAQDGTATLDLTLNSSLEPPPASLQWTFLFPSADINSLIVDDGPATTAAGKTVICTENAGAYTCLAVGKNANTIANGVIARVTAVLAPSVASAVISIRDSLGASASGDFIPIASAGGTITRARMSPDRRLHPPLMRIAGRCLPQ